MQQQSKAEQELHQMAKSSGIGHRIGLKHLLLVLIFKESLMSLEGLINSMHEKHI